mgnify:CR=1 FL=1
MAKPQRFVRGTELILIASALWLGVLGVGHAVAGGILLYEVGTPDVGLASAGWGARAQDASTVFTNPAGMTRLEGTQLLLGAQALYGDYGFSIGSGTSSGLGTGDGGNPIGWLPGGVAIVEFIQVVPVYPRSPDLWRFTGPGVERLLRDAGLEPVETVRMGRAPAYVGLAVLLWLNRHNRGPWRALTELPVRLLYVLVQLLAEGLDAAWSGSDEVMSRLVVARPRPDRS